MGENGKGMVCTPFRAGKGQGRRGGRHIRSKSDWEWPREADHAPCTSIVVVSSTARTRTHTMFPLR